MYPLMVFQSGTGIFLALKVFCPCSNWKNQYKAAWLASPEFRKVTWVEVDPPKLKEAYTAAVTATPPA